MSDRKSGAVVADRATERAKSSAPPEREGAVGAGQRAAGSHPGNRALNRLLAQAGPGERGGASPRPLARSTTRGDALERAAEELAARALQVPTPPFTRHQLVTVVPHAAREAAVRAPPHVAAAIADSGSPLDALTRAWFEPRLGLRLGPVRVHTGSAADRAAALLHAQAFAYAEHLVFGAGHYAPQTLAGRRLIAHELAHIRQQALAREAFIARDDPVRPAVPGEVETELRPGLIQREGRGYRVLILGGREWLRLEWDPARRVGPDMEIRSVENDQVGGAQALGLRVRADFEVHATLNRGIEDVEDAFQYRLYSYDLRFRGTLRVHRGDPGALAPAARDETLPYRARDLYAPTRSVEFEYPRLLRPPSAQALDPFADSPLPARAPQPEQAVQSQLREQELIRGQPAFDTRAEMEAYIRQHPDQNFIGIETTFGKFVARRIDEDELQRIADALREDPALVPEVAWDAARRRSAWGVTGVYVNGRAVDAERLRNLYYREPFFAGVGREEEFEEAEVFRVGTHSYGRRTLTHEQATARWTALDDMPLASIQRLDTEPGHRFHALWVRGAGRNHELDESYFRGRDAFYSDIVPLQANWVETYNAMLGSSHGDDIRAFLLAQTDREARSPRLLAALRGSESLAQAVAKRVFAQVSDRAQQLALDHIERGTRELGPYVHDADRMRGFVIGFPDMNAQQRDEAMQFIGVPQDQRAAVTEVLGSRETAYRVALGLEETRTHESWMSVPDDLPSKTRIRITISHTVSLESLTGWAQATLTGLEQAAEQLRSGQVRALQLEGALGNEIRRIVYAEMGFHLLEPSRFPHRHETSARFPDPLDPSGGPFEFSSLAEQLYANHVRHGAAVDTVLHVLRVTALVIASVVLILVAQQLGLALAGLLFAEGSAAFIATEVIASGLIFTGLSEVESRILEGQWHGPGEIVGHAVLNVATFGAFRYLNTLLAAGARSFVAGRVGGEAAFVASRGAQRAAGALRIGGVGATFFTIGLAQRLASGQGFDSWGDFALFAYENVLMLALLEGGAVLARPLMTRTSIWARSNRLGAFESEITALRGTSLRLQRDLASLAARPQAAERDAPALAERSRQALQTQRELCARLRERFRNRSDAAALEAEAGAELQRIQDALDGIEQAKFLTEQHITPIEGSESVFSYRGGSAGIERFRQFYGNERVHVAEDGSIRVEVPGLETGELVFVPAESLQPAAGAGGVPAAPQVPTIVQRQLALRTRQQALLTRARRLRVSDPTLDAISAQRLRVTQRTRPEALNEAEQLITEAERVAGAKMQQLSANILNNVRSRLGPRAIDQIRAGELASVADAELADVLWQARGLHQMGVAQLRALVFASRAGEPAIDFPKLLNTLRRGRFSVADRNFALETFTQMMERGIPGARATLADMAASTGRFRGGLFEMEMIRYLGGIERVRGTQVRRPAGSRAREYDIELVGGTEGDVHVECKDWRTWEYAEESLGDPFARDVVRLCGEGFGNPRGLRRLRYLFRAPAPRPVIEIRAFLRMRLQRLLSDRGASDAVQREMLAAFDDYPLLVEAPALQRTGGQALPEPITAPPSPTLTRPGQDDEDEE